MVEGATLFETEGKVLEHTRKAVKEELHDIEGIGRDLKNIYITLRSKNHTPEINLQINTILTKDKERLYLLSRKIEHLYTINQKLATLDVSLFPNLKEIFQVTSGEKRELLRAYIVEEHKKIYDQYDLVSKSSWAKSYGDDLARALDSVIIFVAKSEVKSAIQCIRNAIALNVELERIMKSTLRLEKKLLQITQARLKGFQKI